MSRRKAAICAIRSHLPEYRLTNEELAREFKDWNVQKIYEKTGISTRAIAAPDECASDLGVAAAERLFVDGVCKRDDIDYLLFCTQSPDYFLPASACVMQDRLGLRQSCGALDINQGCSGFVYGLTLAKGLIESGTAGNVLLITAETYSKYIDPADRSVRTIFGDGGSAALIRTVESDRTLIGPFVLGTDGSGAEKLIVRSGAARGPNSGPTLFMDGPEVFTFTLRVVPSAVRELLHRAGLNLNDVDYFVFHQANRFMLEQLRKKIGIPPQKFCINLETSGNTVSATIPMALERALGTGELQAGAKVLLAGFGVGLSWAAGLVELA